MPPNPSLIGKEWDDLKVLLNHRGSKNLDMKMNIAGAERIRVPAGEFLAIKVEGITESVSLHQAGHSSIRLVYWYAPQVKRTIRFIREVRFSHPGNSQEDIYELASYKLKD